MSSDLQLQHRMCCILHSAEVNNEWVEWVLFFKWCFTLVGDFKIAKFCVKFRNVQPPKSAAPEIWSFRIYQNLKTGTFLEETLKFGKKEDDIIFITRLFLLIKPREVMERRFLDKLSPCVVLEQPVLVVSHLNVLAKGNISLASIRLMLRWKTGSWTSVSHQH